MHRESLADIFGHPASLTATLKLSLGKVKEANPAAAELLRVCAFLAPSAIPEELFVEGANYLGSILESLGNNALAFEAVFTELLNILSYKEMRRRKRLLSIVWYKLF